MYDWRSYAQQNNSNCSCCSCFRAGRLCTETGANALVAVLKNTTGPVESRARAIEALGKIAGALPREQEPRQRELGAAIIEALKSESARPTADNSVVLFGLTAALRSRPAEAGPTIAK